MTIRRPPCTSSTRGIRPRSATALVVCALSFFASTLGCLPARPAARHAAFTAAPVVPDLRSGETVGGELAAGETDEYALQLIAGQLLRVDVEQRGGGEIATVLRGPDGAPVAEAGPTAHWGVKRLMLAVPRSGEHRLVLALSPASSTSATYQLDLADLRLAGGSDLQRIAAERSLMDAVRQRQLGTAKANDEALVKLGEALRLWREVGDARGEADTLLETVSVEIVRNDLSAATDHLEQAYALSTAVDYEVGQANALNDLGLVARRRGDATAALDYLQRALALWEKMGDGREIGNTLYNLGYLHYLLRQDNAAALASYERALPLLLAAGDLGNAANSLNGIGLVYRRVGNLEKAITYFREALDLARRGDVERSAASATTNLAQVHQWRGELQVALELYLGALESFRRVDERLQEAETLQSLGSIYFDLGELDRALASYEEALRIYESAKMPQLEARSLITIGWVHYAQGAPERALEFFARGLSRDRTYEALALHYSGAAHAALGELPLAIDLFKQALALRRAASLRIDAALTDLELGTAYVRAAELPLAREHLGAALAVAREVGYPQLEARCLMSVAHLERREGRLTAALARIEEALRIFESVRSRVAGPQLRTSFFAAKHSHYKTYIDLLMELDGVDPAGGYSARALEACERARARGLLDLLAEGRLQLDKGITPELKQRETELERRLSGAQRQLVDTLSASAPDTAKVAALRGELAQIEDAREELEWESRRRDPAYAAIRYPLPIGLAAMQRELDADTVALEYCLGDERSFLFVVTREGLSSHVLPGASAIETPVRQVRASLAEPNMLLVGQYVRAAQALYRMLVEPAADVVARKRRLLVAPDGALHLLPFEVLLAGEESPAALGRLPYLIKTHAIAYVPSASVLASLRQPRPHVDTPGSKVSFVAFADPVLSDGDDERAAADGYRSAPERWQMQRLPHTAREVAKIAAIYPAAEVALYLREQATEDNVKHNRLFERAQTIHFATHGFIDEEHPQLSGIALARREGSEEDGFLQMYEIFNLSIASDLVVLSACETGLGEQVDGEGLVGLSRAFFYAGARSLIVSLWKVRDAPTPELMVQFYTGVHDGESKIDALRRAKLELVGSGRFAHPAYWSPFVLIGEPF